MTGAGEPAALADGPEAGALAKHSLRIAGHATSVSLEAIFWDELKACAARRGVSLAALVAAVDAARGGANLSSSLRVFVLRELRAKIAQAG